MQLGIIGLGKMGRSLALQAVEKGMYVLAHSKHSHPAFASEGVHIVDTYVEFVAMLQKPRIIYLSLPAGPIIDQVIASLVPGLDRGDVLMDGGNSFFRDSMNREKALRDQGIYFLDCGTSGGLEEARNGACFIVGGSKEGFDIAEPVLKKLAVDGGVLYTGEPGTGHYTKLVHNGIDKEIAVPFISASVMSPFASRGSWQDSNRTVALLRHGYGGHSFGKDEGIARERRTSRLTRS